MRVPVPWVFVLAYLAGLGLQLLVPIRPQPVTARWIHGAGWGFLAVGATIAVWCLAIFRRRRTTTVPFGHSTDLVTWGPYRLSRNPMYVSLTLIYLGEAGILAQAWPLITLIPVIVYVNGTVIPYEESRLHDTFGAAYEDYGRRVGRWIGRGS